MLEYSLSKSFILNLENIVSSLSDIKCKVLVPTLPRFVGLTGVLTRFEGLSLSLVIEVAGASDNDIEVILGVLSRGREPAETPRSTGGPSLGARSCWGTRVPCALVCRI